jgi:hypothetical protein
MERMLKQIGTHPNGYPIFEKPWPGYCEVVGEHDGKLVWCEPEGSDYYDQLEYTRNVFAGYCKVFKSWHGG